MLTSWRGFLFACSFSYLLMPSCFRASIYAVCSRKFFPLPLLDGLAVLVSSMPMLFP